MTRGKMILVDKQDKDIDLLSDLGVARIDKLYRMVW